MISKTKSKKSFAKLLLSLACVLCMAFSVVIPVNAEAANASVTKVSESLVQVRMIYKTVVIRVHLFRAVQVFLSTATQFSHALMLLM